MLCVLLFDRVLWAIVRFGAFSGVRVGPFLATIFTALIVILMALPLSDVFRDWLVRLSPRRRADYQRLLQHYSQVLATQVAFPRLLLTIAEQVGEIFHPSGLAIVLDQEEGFRVTLSRGKLASHPLWREGASFAPGHLITTQLAAQHRTIYLPRHMRELPEHQRQEWLPVAESGVCVLVPMRLRGSLLGWLALGPKPAEVAYTRHDLDCLGALAERSCVAIENARLFGEMQQRATELAMIAMISSVISSSLDVEYVLQTIVESVIQVVNCDKSALFELSEDGTELNLRMGRGLSQTYAHASRHISVAEDERALSVSTGKPFIVPDVWTEPRLAAGRKLAEQEGYRAVIDVPLSGREGLLGVLSVYFDRVHAPSASELEILTTFANHAAIAMENARLYAAMTRERDRVRRLYEQTDAVLARRVKQLISIEEISRQLTGTLDVQQVMDLVLERAMQTTEADRGAIALCDPKQHALWLMAQEGYPRELKRYRSEPWPSNLSITARVARTGVAALVPDVRQDLDYVEMVASTRSQLSVPIIHDRKVLGVISLESDRRAAFTEEHAQFTHLLAEHAAIGINNAQLFQQVVEGRDQLQAILNSTQDVVIVTDTEGQVILTNPRVGELFGAQAEQWLLSAGLLDEALPPVGPPYQLTDADAEKLSRLLGQLRRDPGRPVDIAFSFENGDREVHLEGTASPVLSAAGEVLGRVVVLRDVTHQQELEQFREDMTSMIIHNLQGPLAALISSLDTLLEDDQTEPAVAAELLRIAASSGRKLYSRIESVLWIRRLEDKRIPLNLQAQALAGVVQSVVHEYTSLAATLDVDLEVTLDPDLPPVLIDEEIVGRVFSNLLDNALKHTPQGGRIQVQASSGRGADEAFVLCVVADTGSGIPEEIRQSLFGKFRRTGQPLHGRRKGLGIGLHYCKLAIEAHGGRIWVDSREGRGSTFHFTLPVPTAGPGTRP